MSKTYATGDCFEPARPKQNCHPAKTVSVAHWLDDPEKCLSPVDSDNTAACQSLVFGQWHCSCSVASGKDGKEVKIVKNFKSKLSMLLVIGVLGTSASVLAADGVTLKEEIVPESYSHMRFPAIRPSTLAGSNPELKSSTTGDVIDFYGPCDESPVGKDQVESQNLEYAHRLENNSD
jgi:hypothetical protein